MPFWSPDGAQIGFFADGKLKRLDPRGGPAQTICDAPTPRGGAWGPDGRIVFTPSFRTGLSIVPASGGTPQPLTTLDEARDEKSHRFPVFLPGGKRSSSWRRPRRAARATTRAPSKRSSSRAASAPASIVANSSPLFSPTGQHPLLARRHAVRRSASTPSSSTLAGEPVAIASPVAFTQNEQVARRRSRARARSSTAKGRAAPSRPSSGSTATGSECRSIRDRELFADFALSHDGKRLAFAFNAPDRARPISGCTISSATSASRLTFEEGGEDCPVWSRGRPRHLLRQRPATTTARSSAARPTAPARPKRSARPRPASGRSPPPRDGRWLAVGAVGSATSQDILRFDLATKKITPLVDTPFLDEDPALSPDDRLLAYASEQSGRWEVYVQALGGERGRWQISSEGGLRPRWRADGRELFFLARPDRLMSVDVEPGEVPRFSAPRELFREPIESFDVTPDGQHFVALRSADSDVNRPLTLVTNWPQLAPQK